MDTMKVLWNAARVGEKRSLPVLSFPAAQKLGVTVRELVHSAELQAQAIAYVANNTPTAAAVSLMDLSVEAEAFGATVRFADHEVPAVIGKLVDDADSAEALAVPPLTSGRPLLCVEAVRRAKELVKDKPVIAGVIGPFSLAGRLMDVTEIMYACYDEPEVVNMVVDKAAAFILEYCRAFKEAGADGVLIAEPLAGLLRADMAAEFSCPAVTRIIEAVRAEDFPVIYHNCGNATVQMIPELHAMGADAYHFGNAVSMAEVLSKAPADMLCMGNISPANEFAQGTPESIRKATRDLLDACGAYPNFVPSSGCDIPAHSSWDNINAFFEAVEG